MNAKAARADTGAEPRHWRGLKGNTNLFYTILYLRREHFFSNLLKYFSDDRKRTTLPFIYRTRLILFYTPAFYSVTI